MPNPNIKDYAVKFGEGQDPTKGGAPKGKRITTIIKELLNKDASEIGIENLPKGVNGNKAIAIELLSIAFDKNGHKDKLSALKEVLDRLEGRSKQTIKIDRELSKEERRARITALKEQINANN